MSTTYRTTALEAEPEGEVVTEPDYRIALRPDSRGRLDDTVVKGVSMFRAEIMDRDALWMCCYLEGSDQRISFWVRGKNLRYDVTEFPFGNFEYEAGSIEIGDRTASRD